MNRSDRFRRTAVAAALAAVLSPAWAAVPGFAPPAAQVVSASSGQAMGRAQGGQQVAAVGAALRSRGASAKTADSLVQIGGGPSKFGNTHLRLEQQLGGLTIYGTSVKAAFSASGELFHLIEQVVAIPDAAPTPAAIGERQALDAAMAQVHPGVQAAIGAATRSGNAVRFAGSDFFYDDPTVTRVLVPQADGSLAEGFLVQTWTLKRNLLDYTLVGGDGSVLNVERRTANDNYNVFTKDPAKTPQAIVAGPGAGNAQSPAGWLGTGAQTTININGNNVSAYLDADANNRPDRGGTAVTNGNFTATANLGQAPTTTSNLNVAVQNLFYLNNVIHDILYGHGFNEGAGNFQINNFGKGGAGNDPVNAEAQDGSGTDNANFATPNDGQRPRMQMYLWTGAGPTYEVVVNGTSYGGAGASFGAVLTTTGVTGPLAIMSPNDGCTAATAGSLTGKLAIIDRGTCNFDVKVKNAQAAGAKGAIIANNQGDSYFTMGAGGVGGIKIGAVMVGQSDGTTLKWLVNSSATERKKVVQPLKIDGDLDSDIVYHEYGHGLTWRMIGGMNGPLAGAIGEGASDVVAFMVNGDPIMGEYAYSNPAGIRRYSYEGYPLKYADVTGGEVHDDGEIYAAAMWFLRDLWIASGREASIPSLFDHFVDGMNYTPSSPAFENMRNGMLQSIAKTAGADATTRCTLVWQAFAQFGIGDGATGRVLSSTSVSITPSIKTRSDCTY